MKLIEDYFIQHLHTQEDGYWILTTMDFYIVKDLRRVLKKYGK